MVTFFVRGDVSACMTERNDGVLIAAKPAAPLLLRPLNSGCQSSAGAPDAATRALLSAILLVNDTPRRVLSIFACVKQDQAVSIEVTQMCFPPTPLLIHRVTIELYSLADQF